MEAIQRKTWREWYHEAKGGENFNEGTMVKWSTVVLKFVNLAKMELISRIPFPVWLHVMVDQQKKFLWDLGGGSDAVKTSS